MDLWIKPWRELQGGAYCRQIGLDWTCCAYDPWSLLGWWLEDMDRFARTLKPEVSNA